MDATPRRLGLRLCRAVACATLGLLSSPSQAQQGDAVSVLVSTPWCHESSTGLSFHTTRLRFQPNGVMLTRKDTEMANGSHRGTNSSARWELVAGLLIIREPNGGESRLPMTVAGSGRAMRLRLGKMTYAVCR